MGRRIAATIAGVVALTLGTVGSAAGSAGTAATEGATLGPEGYKTLRLGQSEREAEATGLVRDRQTGDPCHVYNLAAGEGQRNVDSGVFVDPVKGVVMIGGTVRSHTPEGVTLGSRLERVRAAYPSLRQVPPMEWVYEAPVPGNPAAAYRFAVDERDRVADFALEARDMGACG
ncbi:hypothetical protein SAMN05421810_10326 [Amycolatopsis arida]|uniref:Secreted protein n=2 Tax=Amycolatopsis arida TaxID=587909 RepID=A0A1I5S6B5_9PSEU|nr:hypothetical protein CLV69_11626 [Amycolatopsis arida]SFP66318.1 hypothetical protein SAMN05421810_10326 [Amycolatopsis arida]